MLGKPTAEINIIREIKENEHLKKAFIQSASAMRIYQLGYGTNKLFMNLISHIAYEDILDRELYTIELFDKMTDLILFNNNYHFLLTDFIKEGAILPAFVAEYPDLKLGVEYSTRKSLSKILEERMERFTWIKNA